MNRVIVCATMILAMTANLCTGQSDAKIDKNGVLRLKGHFETAPKQVKYQLGFIPSDGSWKLSGVSIDTRTLHQGDLFIATGDDGKLFKLTPEGRLSIG